MLHLMLSYFGGTTRNAKSDNMKQWVRKHERYEPIFNDAAVEWAAYYDTNLMTCRYVHLDKGQSKALYRRYTMPFMQISMMSCFMTWRVL